MIYGNGMARTGLGLEGVKRRMQNLSIAKKGFTALKTTPVLFKTFLLGLVRMVPFISIQEEREQLPIACGPCAKPRATSMLPMLALANQIHLGYPQLEEMVFTHGTIPTEKQYYHNLPENGG